MKILTNVLLRIRIDIGMRLGFKVNNFRKTFLTLACLLMTTTSWGQVTVKKKVKNEMPPYKETYYVLKDDQEMKHGLYTKVASDYSVKGNYENNVRTGIWQFTGKGGRVTQRIDFTTGVVTHPEPRNARLQMKILSIIFSCS